MSEIQDERVRWFGRVPVAELPREQWESCRRAYPVKPKWEKYMRGYLVLASHRMRSGVELHEGDRVMLLSTFVFPRPKRTIREPLKPNLALLEEVE